MGIGPLMEVTSNARDFNVHTYITGFIDQHTSKLRKSLRRKDYNFYMGII